MERQETFERGGEPPSAMGARTARDQRTQADAAQDGGDQLRQPRAVPRFRRQPAEEHAGVERVRDPGGGDAEYPAAPIADQPGHPPDKEVRTREQGHDPDRISHTLIVTSQ
jgi:hypothetical protein